MGRKCPVPNYKLDCKSQAKDTKTTFHKFRKECENKIHRGEKWSMITESFICSKHFEESDFVYHTNDTNNPRNGNCKRKSLNTDM